MLSLGYGKYMHPILFELNKEKCLESILFVLNKKPNIPVVEVLRILFVADKLHLNRHHRTISGDSLVRGASQIIGKYTISIATNHKDILRLEGKKIHANRQANQIHFSKSDIGCLKEAIANPNAFNELEEWMLKVFKLDEIIPFEVLIDNSEAMENLKSIALCGMKTIT